MNFLEKQEFLDGPWPEGGPFFHHGESEDTEEIAERMRAEG